jgi:VWFA-related protein
MMPARVNSPPAVALNKKLRDTLLKLKETQQKGLQDIIAGSGKTDSLSDQMRESREKNTALLCPILKEFGWPSSNLVGHDGVNAAFYILRNSSSLELQKELFPVIVAATKKGEIDRAQFAGYVDRLRLNAGLRQLFGTQSTITNGLLVLYPIESEAHVEQRRKQYDLPPLREYIRTLERIYQLPLVKSTGTMVNSFPERPGAATAGPAATSLFEGEAAEDEVIRVVSNLVSLNVSVHSSRFGDHVGTLEEKDFAVFEDGQEETVTFFAATDVPFDLVLLIDLSGSTSSKRDLIRQTTRSFIEAARPNDRLAIVTFSDTEKIISTLTSDRKQLFESLEKIEGTGGSNVWDALKFTLDNVIGPRTLERRRAIVMMTDGVDGALTGFDRWGSKIEFADLLESVRRDDTLVVPIYLDSERDDLPSRRVFASARRTLELLAEESGGLYYKARKIEDLSGVYDQVIEDLGKVYSLGYKPTNDRRDGSWRTVNIRILNRPDLITRARPGYYAK